VAETELTQVEADRLLGMEKIRADDLTRDYPDLGGVLIVPMISIDRTENFLLDVRRGRIDLGKVTNQNRARVVVILARLDLGGPPHRNPDDTEVPCPHLHLYREGYGDKWAYSVPAAQFADLTDLWRTFQDFMNFCNVTQRPNIVRGLFA